MAYDIALNKAWEDLAGITAAQNFTIKFLADEYSVDLETRKVFSLSCNVPAKDFASILILHYLIQQLKGLPDLSGEWLSFRQLSDIEGYYPSFKNRAIKPLIRKYGNNPEGLLQVLETLPGKRMTESDVSIVLEAFERIPVWIQLWRPDEEFGPDANMLFDKSITKIFCTEDIVVLGGIVAASV